MGPFTAAPQAGEPASEDQERGALITRAEWSAERSQRARQSGDPETALQLLLLAWMEYDQQGRVPVAPD